MSTLSLPFKNESAEAVRLCLEPYSEFFSVKPGQRVVVHAVCSPIAQGLEFVVAHNGSFITIYAPGAPDALVDAYVMLDGAKLRAEPDE